MAHPWFSVRLLHPDKSACEAFRRRFEPLPNIDIHQARYDELPPHDCFVTAGNAYGLMTAGIDAAVVHRLGTPIMGTVQEHIMDVWFGEQPVGTAFVLPTGDTDRPYLCHAPTMRTPGSIRNCSHIYQATFAAFVAIHHHNMKESRTIESVVLPAMGTGYGGVDFDEAARQMAVAYRHYLHPPGRPTWDTVIRREKAICYDGDQKVAVR